MLVTSVNKGVQGRFLTWQNTMQLDLLNYNYKMSTALLKFHLNSTDDVANTPANMDCGTIRAKEDVQHQAHPDRL